VMWYSVKIGEFASEHGMSSISSSAILRLILLCVTELCTFGCLRTEDDELQAVAQRDCSIELSNWKKNMVRIESSISDF
jgi:hypothetical protein